ncbi:MAG TPA: TetR family transcriptional regulator [Gammaproteobacteria bacterium]|nr:TetR family transcriptional regulator [Gammaproteobacteria bacterium]
MGKKHEERKEEIVQGALELAAEQGVKRVTTQAIADKVGIAQPTIFRHFPNRDAIFGAAIEGVAAGLFKILGSHFDGAEPADQRLHAVVVRHLEFIERRQGIPRVLFSDRLHSESPGLKSVVQRIMGRYTARLAGLLEEGVAAGRFRDDLEPEEAARHVFALIQGTLMRWSISDFNFSLAEEAEQLWGFIWAAVAPRTE